jgi:hypothetical protein
METWRKELQNLLNEIKINPYQEWNQKLHAWCKEYVIELLIHNDMHAFTRSSNYPDKGKVQLWIKYKNQHPFIIYLIYISNAPTNIPSLQISFTEKFDYNKRFAKRLRNNFTEEDEDDEDYYKWIEDSIHINDEPYALDKGFVLEYITIQFNKYLNLTIKEK